MLNPTVPCHYLLLHIRASSCLRINGSWAVPFCRDKIDSPKLVSADDVTVSNFIQSLSWMVHFLRLDIMSLISICNRYFTWFWKTEDVSCPQCFDIDGWPPEGAFSLWITSPAIYRIFLKTFGDLRLMYINLENSCWNI